MLDRLSTDELLALVSTNQNVFFTRFNRFSNNKILQEYLARELSKQQFRLGSIFTESVNAISLPVDFLWFVAGSGIIKDVKILTGYGIFALNVMAIFAWYVLTFSSNTCVEKETKILKKKLCKQLKTEILDKLNAKVNVQLRDACEGLSAKLKNSLKPLTPDTKLLWAKAVLPEAEVRDWNREQHVLDRAFANGPKQHYLAPIYVAGVIFTLFSSFFYGVSTILDAYGFHSIAEGMYSRIGLGIALATILAVGIYLGYQRYQYEKHLYQTKLACRAITQHQEQELLNYRVSLRILDGIRLSLGENVGIRSSRLPPATPEWLQQSDHTLLALLASSQAILNAHLPSGMTNRRLNELMERHISNNNLRAGSIINKGVSISGKLINALWFFLGSEVVTNPDILAGLGIFAFAAMVISVWYALTFSAKAFLELEKKQINKRLCKEIKREIILHLNYRVSCDLHTEVTSLANHPPLPLTTEAKKLLAIQMLGQEEAQTPEHEQKALRKSFPTAPSSNFVDPLFAFSVVSTLLGSFFWGMSEIIHSFGFSKVSVAMYSPIGILLAVLIAVTGGIYLGYKRYRYEKHLVAIKQGNAEIARSQETNVIVYRSELKLLEGMRTQRLGASYDPARSVLPSPAVDRLVTQDEVAIDIAALSTRNFGKTQFWSQAAIDPGEQDAGQEPTLHALEPIQNDGQGVTEATGLLRKK